MSPRTALLGSLLALLATPATALAAPVLGIAGPCPRYVPGAGTGRYVPVTGSGFTPGGEVRLAYRGLGARHRPEVVRADALGAFTARILGPARRALRGFVNPVALAALDAQNPTLAATAHLRVVRLGARLPRDAQPGAVVPFRLYGFPNGRSVWAHYAFGGRTVATRRLGRAAAPCGTLTERRRYLPARVRYGTWHLYFSLRRHFTRRDIAHRRYVLGGSFRVLLKRYFRRGEAARRFF